MTKNFLAEVVNHSLATCFALATTTVLIGCATPTESVDDTEPAAKIPVCSPESLASLDVLDVAIAIDNSLSTQHPPGYDVDGDGIVGKLENSIFSDRDDSWLGVQVGAARLLIQNSSDADVRFSIVTFSGYPFFTHRKRSTRAVGNRDARIVWEMTDDVMALNVALDQVMQDGSNGSASFYAGVRRANQSLIESRDPERAGRRIALFISDTPGPIFRRKSVAIRAISARMAAATREAERNDIAINTFGLGEESAQWHALSLGLIAQETGGSYRAVEDPQQLYCHLVDSLVPAPNAEGDLSTALDGDAAP